MTLSKSRIVVTLILVVIVSAGFALYSGYHQLPWSDEGQFSSASYNLAHHGFMGTTVLEPSRMGLTRIQERTYWVFPVYLVGEAAWYRIFPSSVFWTRAFSVFWIPVALVACFLLFETLLGDAATALLATVLLGMEYHFIDKAGFARPELMTMALGLAGLAIYVRLRETRFYLSVLLANTCFAAAVLSHPNAILHMAAFCVLFLYFDLRRLRLTTILVAAVPYVVGVGLYGLYIMQDVEAWRAQLSANGTHNGRVAATLNPFRLVIDEIYERYLIGYGLVTRGAATLKAVALIAYAACLAAAAAIPELRRRSDVRLLFALLGVIFAIQCVFNQKLTFYLVYIIPFYAAMVSVVTVYLWNRYRAARPVLAMATAVLLLVPAAGIVVRAHQRSNVAAERRVLDWVQSHAPDAKVIVGTAGLIYGMHFDPRLTDDLLLGVKTGVTPDVIILNSLYDDTYDTWQKNQPASWQMVQHRLSQYRLMYNQDGYRVYLR